jgi:hypothetical protein
VIYVRHVGCGAGQSGKGGGAKQRPESFADRRARQRVAFCVLRCALRAALEGVFIKSSFVE